MLNLVEIDPIAFERKKFKLKTYSTANAELGFPTVLHGQVCRGQPVFFLNAHTFSAVVFFFSATLQRRREAVGSRNTLAFKRYVGIF